MRCEVEFTEVFGAWWDSLDEEEQESVDASVQLSIELGPALPYPHSSDVKGARHGNMRELRVQHTYIRVNLIGFFTRLTRAEPRCR
jgi:hypothetical protein